MKNFKNKIYNFCQSLLGKFLLSILPFMFLLVILSSLIIFLHPANLNSLTYQIAMLIINCLMITFWTVRFFNKYMQKPIQKIISVVESGKPQKEDERFFKEIQIPLDRLKDHFTHQRFNKDLKKGFIKIYKNELKEKNYKIEELKEKLEEANNTKSIFSIEHKS